jgi:predicted nucleic acid-binding protein
MELVASARDADDLRRLRQFIGPFQALDITPACSRTAYRPMVSYGLSNRMRMPDALTAAIALQNDLTLDTKNIRYFQMIPGLSLAGPYP